ncbi:hypothetical protein FGG08_006548 [Glutinoglossum americanum]|uniref:Riboflavin synthase n=1 Tax=Glutinoglossum americanum TaxID=1670608 RepID=A0A9P8L1T0_9PEZI|nr:hypothetical protein FGG08_006548 [Glutinoglossum americanum]
MPSPHSTHGPIRSLYYRSLISSKCATRVPYYQHFTTDVANADTLPLDGIKVLDMTRVLAGVNRNKKSVALSFAHKSGQGILQKLAKSCDILVENYLPGTLKKYGLDYESLYKINPSLIYASITGYGQTGPYRSRAGYDVMVEAEMGLMHITGSRDGPPVKVGVAVTDLTTGLYASNSIMAALLGRTRSGKGQYIDVALSDCQVATLSNIASSALISGEKDSGRWGTAHHGAILLGGGNDKLFGILCTKLGKPHWTTDERFATNTARVQNREVLEAMIEEETRKKTMQNRCSVRVNQDWLEILHESGMPYAAINDIQDTLNHSHVIARNMITTIDHPHCGPLKLVNTPVKYSHSMPSIRSPPPMLGEHTEEVLREVVGLNKEEVMGLKMEGTDEKKAVAELKENDESEGGGTSLTIKDAGEILGDAKLGDSICVNGTCLTISHLPPSPNPQSFTVGLSPETLRLTTLSTLRPSTPLNLERSLLPTTRLGGHFVQGHVDTTALITRKTPDGNAVTFRVQPRDQGVLRYVVKKGYVALDGTSLTVTEVGDEWWEVMLVRYTQERVVVAGKGVGDEVNVEVDMLGKYVERGVRGYFEGGGGGAVERAVRERLGGMLERDAR